MTWRWRFLGILVLLGTWGGLPGRAFGQGTIVCESHRGAREYCAVDARGGVEMARQLSSAPCERGKSWGFDGGGIWVDRSCKAEFRILIYRGRGPVWWNSGGHGPADFREGACFFSDANFGGEYFCMKRGESYDTLPPGFNDRISSVQLYGRARATVFNDSGFRGIRLGLDKSIDNLKRIPKQDDPRKTWNDRISSIRVD
jgi:hypothetical protein